MLFPDNYFAYAWLHALAQAHLEQEQIMHNRIADRVRNGNKVEVTVASAVQGKEAATITLDGADSLSAYEVRRLDNIQRNAIELKRLELAQASHNLMNSKEEKKAKRKKSGKRKPKAMPAATRRRSTRQRSQPQCLDDKMLPDPDAKVVAVNLDLQQRLNELMDGDEMALDDGEDPLAHEVLPLKKASTILARCHGRRLE